MKLKTKLAVFSILLTVVAVAVCLLIILSFVQSRDVQAASDAALAEYRTFARAFIRNVSAELPQPPAVRRSFLIGAFRSVDGFRDFALRVDGQYLCNNLGFDIESLSGKWQSAPLDDGGTVDHLTARVGGRDYFLARAVLSVNGETYHLSFARDITAVTDGVRTLARACAAAGLAVAAVAAMGMWLLVSRSLRPVAKLKAGAAELARGHYQNRIALGGRDELAELAADFNSMADAVEANVGALHERAERQQTFIHDLSHELKTPVTSILLCSDTLLRRNVAPDARERLLQRIFDQGRWLEQLSGKLMALSLLQGQVVLKEESVEALFSAVRESTADALAESRVALTTDCKIETLPMDFDLMRAALGNLVINAQRASGAGQTVTLRAYDRTLAVRDRGSGIPPEDLPRVTEPFYTADRSRSKKHGGAGLGLALTERIAAAHGAALFIESTPGVGTTVRIVFGDPKG